MFRYTLSKALSTGTSGRYVLCVRTAAASAGTPAKAPEKIEVFVDDQSVMVEPGTTVLQVSHLQLLCNRTKLTYRLMLLLLLLSFICHSVI